MIMMINIINFNLFKEIISLCAEKQLHIDKYNNIMCGIKANIQAQLISKAIFTLDDVRIFS